MAEELISKKELLELTGISYGQLYRWKRKDLIPEEWFIKKSAVTGQETFFPKEKILPRIDKIKNMKEDLSLEDLAGVLSSGPADVSIRKDELITRGLVSERALAIFNETLGAMEIFNFKNTLFAYLLEKAVRSGDINQEEAKLMLRTLADNYEKFEGKEWELILTRKIGAPAVVMAAGKGGIYFDRDVKVAARYSLSAITEELKAKI